jgi:hypothetical protein
MLAALAIPVSAQNAISAKAGLVQVADGEVFVNDQAVQPHAGEFIDLKRGDTLRTEEGRVELLLTPGSFLRAGDNSALRMTSAALSDVEFDVLAGEAVVEIAELLRDNAITLHLGAAGFGLAKDGIYRLDAKPARLRVYSGQAAFTQGDKTQIIRAGHELALIEGEWKLAHFDVKDTDALYRWSSRRAESVAVANVSAARQASFTGYGSGYGAGNGYGALSMTSMAGGYWMLNPYYGMYTFLPGYDTVFSPFGYSFYTPITVVPVYNNPPSTLAPGVPGKATSGRVLSPSSIAALHTGLVTRGASASPFRPFGGRRSEGFSSVSGSSSISPSTSHINSTTGTIVSGGTSSGVTRATR